MIDKKILAFAQQFIKSYYQDRDLKTVLSLLHPDVRVSSIQCQKILRGKQEVQNMLGGLVEDIDYHFEIKQSYFDAIRKDDKHILLFYKVDVLLSYQNIQHPLSLYGSLLLVQEDEEYLLSEVYVSLYRSEKEFIHRIVQQIEDEKNLKNANTRLELLTNNVPGGIFKCLFNEELTILYMSDGFLSMVGYTKEEINDKFHNSFWEMIDPQDRIATRDEVNRQMKLGKTKQIEYRIVHKDGHSVWVLDKGQLIEGHEEEGPSFYCIMIDITNEKSAREELKLALERFKIIIDQTNDIVFEWDIVNNQLHYSQNLEKLMGKRIPKGHIKEFLTHQTNDIFHPEDIIKWKEILLKIKSGYTYMEEEFRLSNSHQHYQWWRLRLTIQLSPDKKPMKAIGIFIDIDQEKRRSQYLISQAQQDALTGIFNKITSQNTIKDYLAHQWQNELCAMMIIDIDNFKEVNDGLGHLFGDAVLSDIARRMKKIFHHRDIIGRIGGDEFIVFLINVRDIESIKNIAKRMIDETHHLQVSHEHEVQISCSIGISIAPIDGRDFTCLFQKADQALYQAKSDGKNQCVIYDEKNISAYLMNSVPVRSVINETIDSDKNSHLLTGQLAEYVFRMLYQSENIQLAIASILEIVGLQFDVSRVYIFENSEDGRYCSNTYEWCNKNIEPQIDKLTNVSYERDLGNHYLDQFNEEGIFYCSDISFLPKKIRMILEKQGIKSLLQCAIMDNGYFKGYVGFDECRKNRYWTQNQIDALVFISEILSVFLLKSRAELSYQQESVGLRELLDNQNALIYVINPFDYKICFVNHKANQISPKFMIGRHCYEVFMKKDGICENCPLKKLNEEVKSIQQDIYNDVLNMWLDVNTTYVSWNGQKAVMLCCHDITQYKQREI